jgi:ABC-type multidrug transport system ATPase subunit
LGSKKINVLDYWDLTVKNLFFLSRIFFIFIYFFIGAGKSTTFKILTGEVESSNGTAFINGNNINKNRMVAQKNIGFCPQNDYLPEYLNVSECLHLFARLKGLYFDTAKKSIDDIMKLFKLTEHKSKLVKNLR